MRNVILKELKALLREQNNYPEEDFMFAVPNKEHLASDTAPLEDGGYADGAKLLDVAGDNKGRVRQLKDRQWVTLREPGDYSTPEPAPEPDPEPAPKSTTKQGYELTDRGITPTTIGDEGKGVLGIGARGIGVEALQKMLMDVGYDVGPQGQDGLYGPKTKAAVQQLQKDLGVTQDGIYGPKTHKAWQDKEFKKLVKVNESVYNHWQKLIKG